LTLPYTHRRPTCTSERWSTLLDSAGFALQRASKRHAALRAQIRSGWRKNRLASK
jgi:hypothetical protein